MLSWRILSMERYSWWWLLFDVMEALRWPWRMMMLCYLDWWLGALVDGGLAWMMSLFMEVLVRWWFGDSSCSTLYLQAGSCTHLRVGSLKPLLVGSKRTLAGSSTKSWISYFSWSWMIWEDWSLPHRHYCIKWFLSIYYWVFHSYLVSIFYVIDLLLWCFNDQ